MLYVYTKRSGHFCSIISVLFEKIPITPDISVFIGDYINNRTFTRLNMKQLYNWYSLYILENIILLLYTVVLHILLFILLILIIKEGQL